MSISKITTAPQPLEEVAKLNELVDNANNKIQVVDEPVLQEDNILYLVPESE